MNRRAFLARLGLGAGGAIATPLAALSSRLPPPQHTLDGVRRLMRDGEVFKTWADPAQRVWVGWLEDGSGFTVAWLARDGNLWRVVDGVYKFAGVAR